MIVITDGAAMDEYRHEINPTNLTLSRTPQILPAKQPGPHVDFFLPNLDFGRIAAYEGFDFVQIEAVGGPQGDPDMRW